MAIQGLATGISMAGDLAKGELAKTLNDNHRPVGAVIVNRSTYDFSIQSYEAVHGTWRKHPSTAIDCADSITSKLLVEAQDKLGVDSLSQNDLKSYFDTHYKQDAILQLERSAITQLAISGHARGAQGVVLLQATKRELIDGVLQPRIYLGTHIALMVQRKYQSYKAGALIMDDDQLSQFGEGGVNGSPDGILRMIVNSPDAKNWRKSADVVHRDQVLEERAVMEHGAFSEGSTVVAKGRGFKIDFEAGEETTFEIFDEDDHNL